MPVLRELAAAGAALFTLLFVSNAIFGEDTGNWRFEAALYDGATYAPRPEDVAAMNQMRFMREAPPAVRVREVFAQFLPSEGQRGKRYSSLTTIIR